MRVPTVKLKNKESGQSIIVNESDYHELDGTIKPKWKGWAPVGFNQLTDIDVKANKAEAEAKKKEAAAVEKAKKDQDAALVDEVPLDGQDLADYIEALPNKGAVIAFGQSKGLDLDGTLIRSALNQECFEGLTQGDEGADILDQQEAAEVEEAAARGENLPAEDDDYDPTEAGK